MLKKLQLSTFMTALRMGGFIGWMLTVMYICKQSLHYYRDDSMLVSVNVTFLTAAVITCAVLVIILLLLDFEGLLSDKLLRWLPGIFMAETGIALSLANAATMNTFAAIAGVSCAFGMLAVMCHLLRVKVGQRMISIGLALALGALLRLISGLIIAVTSQGGLLYVSIGIGLIAALTVHSDGFSSTDAPIVSFAESAPRTIISKVPYIYIVLFFCTAAFHFSFGHAEAVALTKIPDTFLSYDTITCAVLIAAAVAIALLCKLPMLSTIFVCGTGLAACAVIFASLPYFTTTEATIFAVGGYCANAAVTICIYTFIILFSLDRPHPLFYAMLGYTFSIGGQLAGIYLDSRISLSSMRLYIALLLLLMPVGGGLMAAGMKKYGFSGDQLDKRHKLRALLKRKGAQSGLLEREQMMLEAVVLDGADIEQLSGKMLFSHNTVKVLLRPVLKKFGVSDLDGLRKYFSGLSEDEEKFNARIQAAEQEKKDQLRRDKALQLRQSLMELRAEKEAARQSKEQELLELSRQSEVVDAELVDASYPESDASDESDVSDESNSPDESDENKNKEE